MDGRESKLGADASGSPLHETFGYPPVHDGGTETYIQSLSAEWDKVSVRSGTPRLSKEMAQEAEEAEALDCTPHRVHAAGCRGQTETR